MYNSSFGYTDTLTNEFFGSGFHFLCDAAFMYVSLSEWFNI